MQTILITGATSGFGEAIARLFAQHPYRLIITGRRKERLAELAQELKAEVLPLCFDVRNFGEVEAALGTLPEEWRQIDVLVNNAGLAAGLSSIQEGSLEDWEQMLDTNVKGLLYVSKMVMPQMIARKTGHIINIGSVAGKEVYPNGNVYCASKHAVDALTKSMRMDLLPHNIRVTQVAPGLAETEFSIVRFKGDEARAKKVYEGITPLFAQDIAEIVYFAATRPAHVCLNDIVVMPTQQAAATLVHRA